MQLVCFVVLALIFATAQSSKQATAQPGVEYSGMYNFLRDGEFVQVTVEDQGNVTGFISRFGIAKAIAAHFSIISSSKANSMATSSRSLLRRYTESGSNFAEPSNAVTAGNPVTRRTSC